MNKKMCSQQCCFSNLLGRAEKSAQGEYKYPLASALIKKKIILSTYIRKFS
jgi:hypothetical protein